MLDDSQHKPAFWNARFMMLACITLAAAASRLIPHPPNFTPIGAIALFGGTYFASKRAAFAVPLAALVISNFALALLQYGGSVFPLLPFVYASFALTVCLGLLLRNHRVPWAIGATALASAVIFFVLSNFGVWLNGGMYPLTAEGLVACYIAAIPFFRNMVWGNLVYVTVLFGSFELAMRFLPAIRETPATILLQTSGEAHDG